MLQRCNNPKNPNYQKYGAVGVTVCERWKVFTNFLEDMGERPDGMSLDRVDPHLGYSPENCRWATAITQARNRRKPTTTFEQAEEVRKLKRQGLTPKQVAEALGLTVSAVDSVVYGGNIKVPDPLG